MATTSQGSLNTMESSENASSKGASRQSASSSHHSEHSNPSNGSSSSHATSNTHQSDVKTLLEEELRGRRCWSTTRAFLESFEPLPIPVNYIEVLEKLDPGITARPGNESYVLPRTAVSWPPQNSSERKYYQPFAELLQHIQQVVRSVATPIQKAKKDEPKSKSLMPPAIKIFKYDKVMADSPDASWALKPDGLGALRIPVKSEHLPWKVVDFAFEVKNNDSQAFIQVASYARAILAARPGRRYTIALTFNQVSFNVQFHLFGRSLASSSVQLPICTVAGFRSFVRISTAFLCTLGGGEDHSQDSYFMAIPGHLLQVKNILANRLCVTGRATRVITADVFQMIKKSEPDEKGRISASITIPGSGENPVSVGTFHCSISSIH
jgi:hypothetical protein